MGGPFVEVQPQWSDRDQKKKLDSQYFLRGSNIISERTQESQTLTARPF
jgi:hypothetical protein